MSHAGKLRIVSWNCAQAAHRKVDALLELEPDVAVLCECADPEKLQQKVPNFKPTSRDFVHWRNPQRGLAVFAFGDYTLTRAPEYDEGLRLFLPVHVSGPHSLNLLATWALSRTTPPVALPNSPSLIDAVEHYGTFLSEATAVMAGDFNGGVQWDGPRQRASFANLDVRLRRLGLTSAIHARNSWELGREERATYFDRSRKGKAFHIDYVYTSDRGGAHIESAWVEPREEWANLSDHVPLVVDLEWV